MVDTSVFTISFEQKYRDTQRDTIAILNIQLVRVRGLKHLLW